VDDPIRQIGMLLHDLTKTLISGNDGLLLPQREREVKAIVGRMVEIDRQTCRGRGKLAHGGGNNDRRRP
jgi:hypothetical protein